MLLSYFKRTFSTKPKIGLVLYLSLERVTVSLMVFIFIIGFSSGVVQIAKGALPGNFLYPVKLGAEKIQMVLAFNQSQKTVLRAEILTNRLSEVNVLAKKVESGDKNAESELQGLTKSVSDDLYILKQQVAAQVQVDSRKSVGNEPQSTVQTPTQTKPFPEEDLLVTGQPPIIDEYQSSLPIQDQMPVFTVIQSQELKQLLSETKELLAEENLVTALAKIEQAEKVVKEQPEQSEQKQAANEETEIQPVEKPVEESPIIIEPATKQNQLNSQLPLNDLASQPASTGAILKKLAEPKKETTSQSGQGESFSIDIKKEVPVKTGLIREK